MEFGDQPGIIVGWGGIWWSSNNMGGSTVARMFVRMISSPRNLIKRNYYVRVRPSWARVMMVMMMMILIVENHFASVEL